MAKLFNLARMTTVTTGTGTITLGSAVAGHLSFASAGVNDGNSVFYGIIDGSSSEVGTGTYTASGTTLTRSVVKSTNADAAISLSGGAQVFITALAQSFREILTAVRHYYVRTDGSNTNDGLADTSARAFGTIQRALDAVARDVDISTGYPLIYISIHIADGTYNEKLWLRPTLANIAHITVFGNLTTPANVVVKPLYDTYANLGYAGVLACSGCHGYTFYGITFDGTDPDHAGGACLNCVVADVDFDTCHFKMADNSNNYPVTLFQGQVGLFGVTFHMNGTHKGVAWVRFHSFLLGSSFVLGSGTPVLSDGFVVVEQNSTCQILGTFSGWGGLTGPRFLLRDGGRFTTTSTSSTYVPGSTDGVVDASSSYNAGTSANMGARSAALGGVPTTTQLPIPGTCSIVKDTSGGTVYLAYNDGGSIKTVALT